jgi:dienelactone hydrolase
MSSSSESVHQNFTSDCPGTATGKKRSVGFCQFQLFDVTRKDRIGSGGKRQFEVLVWYPGLALSYTKPNKRASSRLINLGNEIPVSDSQERFPILLFSHDVGTAPENYSKLAERFASEGYFVFSINHPYVSKACSIIDAVTNSKKTVSVSWWIRGLSDFLLLNAQRKLIGRTYDEKWVRSKKLLPRWMRLANICNDLTFDKSFLVTFLEQLKTKVLREQAPYSIFSNRLDLGRIGVVGHGWGGTSAVTSLLVDGRFSAGINLDGFQFDNSANASIDKPLLMIYSRKNSGINEGLYFCTSDYRVHTINGAKHESFTDLVGSLPQSNSKTNQIMNETLDLMVGFLDQHVKKAW